jgi:hypothetical protein
VILAAGLSPAWQQIVVLDQFRPSEVNRAREVHWCGSGKVLNVGLALHHLGTECRLLSLLGGLAHDAIEQEFAELGVPRRWIRTAAPTRVCTTVLDTDGTATELVENARPVTADEIAAFKDAFREEAANARFVVLTGSLPAGVPPTFYRDLLAENSGRAIRLGAPYWDPKARGAIFGLTRDTGIKEIVTAGLQAVCYQTRDLLEAMRQDGAAEPSALRVDGGMVENNWVMQFLADILGVPVERPEVTETTALGVAYLAGLKAGVYRDLDEISGHWQRQQRFEPRMDSEHRSKLYHGWLDAVQRVRSEG